MTARGGILQGPRPVGALVPAITRPTFRRHSPAVAQIMTDWAVIVGPKIASMTTPRSLQRGTLTISCAGPVAMELHYVGVELINRINAHVGGQQVHSLRFTQAGMPPRTSPAHLPPPSPPPEAIAKAEKAVADFPEGELRSALASLGRVVLGRTMRSTRRPGSS
jgi:hypothetical protein